MKIVILDGFTVVQEDLNWDALKEFGELVYHERTPKDQVIPRIIDAEMILTSKCIIDRNVIDSSPKLKYIGVIATGYNNVDIGHANKKGITVTNIPAYSTESVAQLSFALLLDVYNQVGLHNESVHRGDWENNSDFSYTLSPQNEIAGKTMGIIGYGNIGKKVAAIARAFDMDVLINSSHMKSKDSTKEIEFVEFDELLARSDIVSLHCKMTDDNKEMINKESLSKMKDGSILINTARGPLVDIDDLSDALKKGKPRAAALDVLPEEPPKPGSEITRLSNCIITPHIAWITKEARQKLIDIAVNNVDTYLCGNPINTIK